MNGFFGNLCHDVNRWNRSVFRRGRRSESQCHVGRALAGVVAIRKVDTFRNRLLVNKMIE